MVVLLVLLLLLSKVPVLPPLLWCHVNAENCAPSMETTGPKWLLRCCPPAPPPSSAAAEEEEAPIADRSISREGCANSVSEWEEPPPPPPPEDDEVPAPPPPPPPTPNEPT